MSNIMFCNDGGQVSGSMVVLEADHWISNMMWGNQVVVWLESLYQKKNSSMGHGQCLFFILIVCS